jgi:RecA-family ATPase
MKKVRDVERFTRSKQFKLFDAPSNSTKASDISLILDNYEHYEGFIPDVILIDYPDILKYESNKETRHAINDTWLTLRAISQERNCLVIVVSHTNKATLDRDVKSSDFAENSAKLNHITQALSINQSEDDVENGVQRISVLADRFEHFNPSYECVVTQCLDIGAVHLDSRVVKKN